MAFSNSLLGVGHALAHPIGGLYDANHGNVNAVLLPEVLRFDFPVVKPKVQEMAIALGSRWSDDETGAEETSLEAVLNMLESGGAPSSLRSLGVHSDDLELIAERAFKDICVLTSPRETDESDLLDLLKKAY